MSVRQSLIDLLVGGEGDNLFVVRHRDDQVFAESADGANTVPSHVSFTLYDNLHNLTLLGRSGINATGNELDSVLTGNSGSNRLDGVADANTMIDGRGNNSYVVHSTDDVVIEQPGEGNDTVESHIDYVLPDNVENLTLLVNMVGPSTQPLAENREALVSPGHPAYPFPADLWATAAPPSRSEGRPLPPAPPRV